jgi:predicted RND superfamily exporter protein
MQVNIILDRHGYYVIDFIETRKGGRPNKKQVLDEFSKTIKKRTFTNIENMSDFYKSNITTWKKIIKDEFSNTAGISIKYYGYNELATITLVNKDLFPIYNNRRL